MSSDGAGDAGAEQPDDADHALGRSPGLAPTRRRGPGATTAIWGASVLAGTYLLCWGPSFAFGVASWLFLFWLTLPVSTVCITLGVVSLVQWSRGAAGTRSWWPPVLALLSICSPAVLWFGGAPI